MPHAPLPPPLNIKAESDASGIATKHEQDLLRILKGYVSDAKAIKKHRITEDHEDNLACYRGDLKPDTEDEDDTEVFYANIVAMYIDIQVGRLTTSRPIVRVANNKKGLKAMASVLGRMLPIVMDKARMQPKITRMKNKSATYGSAGLFVGWDLDEKRVRFDIMTPRMTHVDGAWVEAELLDRAKYVIIERTAALDDVRSRFPGRGAEVKADATFMPGERKLVTNIRTPTLEDELHIEEDSPSGDTDVIPRATVYEAFIVDNQKLPIGKKAFPTGRHVLFSNDVILIDHANPYWDGIHPVDWDEWLPDPEHAWGQSAIKQLRSPQLAINDIMDETIVNHIESNKTTVELPPESVNERTLNRLRDTDRMNLYELKNRNSSINVKPPAVIPADKLNMVDKLLDFSGMSSGVAPGAFGQSPGALQSGKGLQGLQEGASVPGRSKASRLEDFMARVGQKVIARIIQFYSADDILAILGEDDDTKAYAELRQELKIDDDGNPMKAEARAAVFENMRFLVQPGSSEPGSLQRRFQNGAVLFQQQLLAGDELLELADWPDAEGTIERAEVWHKAHPRSVPEGKEGGNPVTVSDSRFPS